MPEIVGISATPAKTDRSEGTAGGRNQLEPGERTMRLAQRIWEAFVRHRWTTSKVALPPWETLDERRRTEIVGLAADALRPAK